MELKVFDKYSKSLLGTTELATAEAVEEVLLGATKSFQELKKTSAGERSAWLRSLASLIQRDSQRLAGLITAEAGKPISYSLGEVARSVTTLNFAADECLKFGGEVVGVDFGAGAGKQAYTQRFPIGPILGIAPFNFPLNLILHKLGPALAVGAPTIIKPSLYTPLTALALEELASEAGIPKSAFQVVVCENELCEKILLDERVKAFSFTGSPKVGWDLKAKVPKKKTTLELGGNAAVIVDQTADLNLAVNAIASGAFLYSGQICISTQRIFIQDEIYNKFLNMLTEKVESLKVGDPHDPATIVGPLIDPLHMTRVSDWVNEAVDAGAQVHCGGEAFDEEHGLYKPTLISDAKNELRIVCEEVFGPVAVLQKFGHFSHALEEVNKSKFGLQAGVFTNRLDHMKQAFNELEVGGVMINNVPGFRVDSMPYGGVKESGFGREGIRYAMEEMTEEKLLVF
ncbi:MAG: aldehyde dehydrogenase [Halobacteriovorax sp.]|nr:aldehyde dehydrogenase [Halobacteriovorax sp.]|tara:strand:- start:110711 stop:112081 length:1371 start_codon:yes stop_codon:yes gene_type:complete